MIMVEALEVYSHRLTLYLRRGAQGHNLWALCTTSLHREQGSAKRASFQVRFRDVGNTERYMTELLVIGYKILCRERKRKCFYYKWQDSREVGNLLFQK